MHLQLKNSVVVICSQEPENKAFGTGFVIAQHTKITYLVTCTHVIEELGGKDAIRVGINRDNQLIATVVSAGNSDGNNLALLQVEGLSTKQPLPLSCDADSGVAFTTAGFHRSDSLKEYREIDGELGEENGIPDEQGDILLGWDLVITDPNSKNVIDAGSSGSPVVQNGHVIAVVTKAADSTGRTARAISIEALKYLRNIPPNIQDLFTPLPPSPTPDIVALNSRTLSQPLDSLSSNTLERSLNPSQPFDVFLAHHSDDKPLVREISRKLKKRGLKPWIDEEQIPPGRSFQESIQEAIPTVKTAAIFLGKDGVGKWEKLEIQAFLSQCTDNGKTIIPVLLPGMDEVPNSLLFLRELRWINFKNADDVKALDLLIWGITAGSEQSNQQKTSATETASGPIQPNVKPLPPVPTLAPKSSSLLPLLSLFRTSFLVTLVIVMLRLLGVMEFFELKAFDLMMQMRPLEPPDDRLLIIGITQDDIRAYEREPGVSGFLKDAPLNAILAKLEQHSPQVIGLDLIRDFEAQAVQDELEQRIQNNDRLIAVCDLPNVDQSQKITDPETGATPPPRMPADRVGFADVKTDSNKKEDPNAVVRRHPLVAELPPNEICTAEESFSLRIARFYLQQKLGPDFSYSLPNAQIRSALTLNGIPFKDMGAFYERGPYRSLSQFGYDILLNYRNVDQGVDAIAKEVSIQDFLKPEFPADKINDRIVLIGATQVDRNPDTWKTPYGEMYGVTLQAHMISQILSHVLGTTSDSTHKRPLLRTMFLWDDTLWIWCWSFIGGLATLSVVRIPAFHQPVKRIVILSSVFLVFLVSCLIMLASAGIWVPCVPALLGSIVTSLVIKKQLSSHQEPEAPTHSIPASQ